MLTPEFTEWKNMLSDAERQQVDCLLGLSELVKKFIRNLFSEFPLGGKEAFLQCISIDNAVNLSPVETLVVIVRLHIKNSFQGVIGRALRDLEVSDPGIVKSVLSKLSTEDRSKISNYVHL